MKKIMVLLIIVLSLTACSKTENLEIGDLISREEFDFLVMFSLHKTSAVAKESTIDEYYEMIKNTKIVSYTGEKSQIIDTDSIHCTFLGPDEDVILPQLILNLDGNDYLISGLKNREKIYMINLDDDFKRYKSTVGKNVKDQIFIE